MDEYKTLGEFRKMNARKQEKYIRWLAHQTDMVTGIDLRVVYTADRFEAVLGTDPVLAHEPLAHYSDLGSGEENIPCAVYCVVRLWEGPPVVEVCYDPDRVLVEDVGGAWRIGLMCAALDRAPFNEGNDAPKSHQAMLGLLEWHHREREGGDDGDERSLAGKLLDGDEDPQDLSEQDRMDRRWAERELRRRMAKQQTDVDGSGGHDERPARTEEINGLFLESSEEGTSLALNTEYGPVYLFTLNPDGKGILPGGLYDGLGLELDDGFLVVEKDLREGDDADA